MHTFAHALCVQFSNLGPISCFFTFNFYNYLLYLSYMYMYMYIPIYQLMYVYYNKNFIYTIWIFHFLGFISEFSLNKQFFALNELHPKKQKVPNEYKMNTIYYFKFMYTLSHHVHTHIHNSLSLSIVIRKITIYTYTIYQLNTPQCTCLPADLWLISFIYRPQEVSQKRWLNSIPNGGIFI